MSEKAKQGTPIGAAVLAAEERTIWALCHHLADTTTKAKERHIEILKGQGKDNAEIETFVANQRAVVENIKALRDLYSSAANEMAGQDIYVL